MRNRGLEDKMHSSLGDRMKDYERVPQTRLARRLPVIMRLDGKAFHSLTKGMDRPFDERLIRCMWETARYLCSEVQGCRLAYVQSDEISLLLTDWDHFDTESWFDYKVQKLVSVSAALATAAFNRAFQKEFEGTPFAGRIAVFDSRAANYPRHEVVNYFVWRERDWIRNSLQMLAQANFSHKELQGKNTGMMRRMLMDKGIMWDDLPTYLRYGACILRQPVEVPAHTDENQGLVEFPAPPPTAEDLTVNYTLVDERATEIGVTRLAWQVDKDIPQFTQERDYIEKFLTEPFWKETT